MPYYGVANGRNVGVYDNWDECKDQVHRYSKCDFKKFDDPAEAWDFVDQRSTTSSGGRDYVKQSYSPSQGALVPKNNTQVALRDGRETKSYQRIDCQEGKNTYIVRERSYASGRHGDNGYFVEERKRTYWTPKNKN